MIKFFVPGKPQPAGSKRAFVIKGTNRAIVTDANANARPWKDAVLAAAIIARRNGEPLEGPLQLDVTFTLIRPKSHYRSGKNAHLLKDDAPTHPISKPDATKLLRGVEDALTGILYRDDAQIVAQCVFKKYGTTQGAEITVAPYVESEF